MGWTRIAAILGFGGAFASAWAGLGPENVALVVNGDSGNSVLVANTYIKLRDIPASNVITLHHLSSIELTDVAHFRSEVLGPVIEALRARGLEAQIDCVTYSVDIPYAVNISSDVQGKPLPPIFTPVASGNGLTYLNELVLKKDLTYLNLRANRYARKLLPLPDGKNLSAPEQAQYDDAIRAYDRHEYAIAIFGLKRLLDTRRNDPNIAYNLACCQSMTGHLDDAIVSLQLAVDEGWRNYGQTASDSDLIPLHRQEGFRRVLRQIKDAPIEVQAGIGFRHLRGWDEFGRPSSLGTHYLLSTYLGITTGRGLTVAEVIDSLKRSKLADETAPKGTVYFEKNGDVRAKTREWGFEPAANELRKLGVNAVVEEGRIPQNRNDVAGSMIGTADFNWPASHSKILPGAIVEHLTSFGGMLNKGAGQTACTEFIRNGASGTSGTVTEPFALQEKFPTPFIHVQYAKGFTLAEAYYLSVSGPYQLLIIGDPMGRPWAKKRRLEVSGLHSGQKLSGVMHLKVMVKPAIPVQEFEIYVDGKWTRYYRPDGKMSFDTRSLPQGKHTLSIIARCADEPESVVRASFSLTKT